MLSTVGLLLFLLLVGCQNDTTHDVGVGVGNTLTISLSQSRTSLGNKTGDQYPVYWSEGDEIVANGACSEAAQIDAEDRGFARFTFNTTLSYPLSITYPYTSTTTAEEARVLFPAEQNYVEGSFSQGSTPMYGYAARESTLIKLNHLTTILRLSVKTKEEGTVLQRVVVTSSKAKLSGEFIVDCKSGKIEATEGTTNTVNYLLPDNFALSTTTAIPLHISIPAGDLGECKIEFFDSTGDKMTALWSPTSSVSAGVVREFNEVVYQSGSIHVIAPFDVEEDVILLPEVVNGYVKDTDGNPIAGVAVSDGFSVVATDSKGFYSIEVTSDTWYIYISIPSEYEVPLNEYGQPCFYKRYHKWNSTYDFTLKPLAGGKESKFALFTFADPQVTNSTNLGRFKTTIPLVKEYVTEVASSGLPCYGITLGDLLSNSSTNNDDAYRDDMRDGFAVSKTGLPVFQVMGNHDCCHYKESAPVNADETSSTYNIKAQRAHEDMFGPVNYSFNRGDVHIVAMRDIIYTSNIAGSHELGFFSEQVKWLRQDLALVPKDKMVVLCVHIQMFNSTKNRTQEVLRLLNEFKEAHVISGHTHIQRNYIHKYEGSPYTKIYEHNTCALCGAWWTAKVAGDGSPNGYNVYVADGNTFVDWYYMGYNTNENKRSHQMRLYRGNSVYGADAPTDSSSNAYGVKGYYGFNFGDDHIVANIYNADADWDISVYENGVYSGKMTLLPYSKYSISNLIGDYTKASPRRVPDGKSSTTDFFAVGIHLGVLGRYGESGPSNGAYGASYHMYDYKLKNKSASVKVVAKDRFGNEYVATEFADGDKLNLYRW